MAVINVIRKTKPSEKADSVLSLALMLRAGTGTNAPLKHLSESYEKTDMGLGWARIRDSAPSVGLADAFKAETDQHTVFPSVVSEMLSAGAAIGEEAPYLERAAEMLERNATGRAKMRSALFTPVLTVILFVALVFGLAVWGVPAIKDYYASIGVHASIALTIIDIGSKIVIVVLGAIIAAAIAWGIFWAVAGRRDERVREFVDRVSLKIPIYGTALHYDALSRLFDIIGPLLRSGLPEPHVLERGGEASGNLAIRRYLIEHAEKMRTTDARFVDFPDGKYIPAEAGAMLKASQAGSAQLTAIGYLADAYKKKSSLANDRVVRDLPVMLDVAINLFTLALTIGVTLLVTDMTLSLTTVAGG